jgi:hypothetical protein
LDGQRLAGRDGGGHEAINDSVGPARWGGRTYTRPWKIFLPLTTQPGYQVLPYECHEGNLALRNILSAARSEEKATEDEVKNGRKPPRPSVWQGNFNAAAPPAEAEGGER